MDSGMLTRVSVTVLTLVVSVSLCGCRIADRSALEGYADLQLIPFDTPDRKNSFQIYDNLATSTLMIEPRVGTADGADAVRRVSGVQALLPVPVYERAVLDYLSSTGRACTLIDRYPVSHPTWLFIYSCGPAPSQVPALKPKR